MKFLISEEEKSRILNMHQNATSKQYLSEQAIYNWEGNGRKLKYKVQANKYYTSRDEGKTWTELTKPEDVDWVKKNVIKPENLDKTAKTTTAAGPAVTTGQIFPITDASGNQLQVIGTTLATKIASEVKGIPVKATIGSIKFATSSSGDYILMPLSVTAADKSGSINYTVYCKGGYSANITKEFQLDEYNMKRWFLVMSDDLQSNPNANIQSLRKEPYFATIFRNNDLSKMNKNLADQATSYFCDAGSLRPTWKAQIG
jgi:hypothetical protein